MKGVKIRSQLHRVELYNCTGWSVEKGWGDSHHCTGWSVSTRGGKFPNAAQGGALYNIPSPGPKNDEGGTFPFTGVVYM